MTREEKIVDLYVKHRVPTKALAMRFSMKLETVRRILKTAGVRLDPTLRESGVQVSDSTTWKPTA